MQDHKPTLMDTSKARPTGPIDWSRFKRKNADSRLGEGTTNSNYLQETREQDPWPEEQADTEEMVVQISKVRFETPTDQLQTNQPFQMSCEVKIQSSTSKRRIAFHLMCRYTNAQNKTVEEDQWPQGFEGFIPADQVPNTSSTIRAEGKLYCPKVEPGTELTYWLVAQNTGAQKTIPSEEVQVHHRWPIHVVEVADLLFHHNGTLPYLDNDYHLVAALSTALRYTQQKASTYKSDRDRTKMQEELIVMGHTDRSGESDYNDALSERRAQAVQSLLNLNVDTWKQLASKHGKVEDYQQILKSLHGHDTWSCDPGNVDNQEGPHTQAALKKFQQQCNQRYQLNLSVDGFIGPQTWSAIHRTLCGLIAQSIETEDPQAPQYPSWPLPRYGYSEGQGCYGCGERFPIESAQRDHIRSEKNRRVELMFLPIGEIPLNAEVCGPYDPSKAYQIGIAIGSSNAETTEGLGLVRIIFRDLHNLPVSGFEVELTQNDRSIWQGKIEHARLEVHQIQRNPVTLKATVENQSFHFDLAWYPSDSDLEYQLCHLPMFMENYHD